MFKLIKFGPELSICDDFVERHTMTLSLYKPFESLRAVDGYPPTIEVTFAQTSLSIAMILLSRFGIPRYRLLVALLHTQTTVIHHCQVVLRRRQALLGRCSRPLHGFYRVGHHATAIHVATPQLKLSAGMALLGSSTQPSCGDAFILDDTITFSIIFAQTHLCGSITIQGHLLEFRRIADVRHPFPATRHEPPGSCAAQQNHYHCQYCPQP